MLEQPAVPRQTGVNAQIGAAVIGTVGREVWLVQVLAIQPRFSAAMPLSQNSGLTKFFRR
jgi:hypothetical protein